MNRGEVDKMAGVLKIREQRTASAQRALQAAQRAVEASQSVRDLAEGALARARDTANAELAQIRHGMMTAGRRGDQIQTALLYVRQLDAKTRAAEVSLTRSDGELARARQQAEIARYEAVDMRVREEKARHMLERSLATWTRRQATREQTKLEGAHEAMSATRATRRTAKPDAATGAAR